MTVMVVCGAREVMLGGGGGMVGMVVPYHNVNKDAAYH